MVFAEGRWGIILATSLGIIPKINFASISCDTNDMTCEEIESFIWTPKEQPILKENLLYHQRSVYQIIDYSDNTIKAKREAPVADIEITISLKDHFAEKSFRETKARGSETSNPNIYGKWILK